MLRLIIGMTALGLGLTTVAEAQSDSARRPSNLAVDALGGRTSQGAGSEAASVLKPSFTDLARSAPTSGNCFVFEPQFVPYWGPSGFGFYSPPLIVVSPSIFPTPVFWPQPQEYGLGQPWLPAPGMMGGTSTGLVMPGANRRRVPPAARRATNDRSAGLVTLGDRHFRSRNLAKASERYRAAVDASPSSFVPHLRLAQIEFSRRAYQAAADRLRESLVAAPNWPTGPEASQVVGRLPGLYANPGQLDIEIHALESYLQTRPDDHDAWLVLGMEWLLTNDLPKASDAFLRAGANLGANRAELDSLLRACALPAQP